MIREESTRITIHQLMRDQKFGVLSTTGEKGPYASLVAFAVSEDSQRLFFVTPRATRKFANMATDARVALLVNNNINRPEDFREAAAVTAVGCASTIQPPELEAVRALYLAKHPYLKEFANSPDSEFLAIQVERYILVEQFQNVTEYNFNSETDANH